MQTGDFNRVPVVLGQTNGERGLFTFQNYDYLGKPLTAATYQQQVRATCGGNADKVLAAYPLSAYGTPGEAWTSVRNGSTSYTRQQVFGTLSRWVPTYAYGAPAPAPPGAGAPVREGTSVALAQAVPPSRRIGARAAAWAAPGPTGRH